MKKAIALWLLMFANFAWCSSKTKPDYQDGVLVSFREESTGSHCSTTGNVDGKVDNDGTVSGRTTGSSNCSDTHRRLYTVRVGENTYVLHPYVSGGVMAGAMATGGISLLFVKDSVLANLLPGTPIKVRTDEHGFFVKVGKRESRYTVVSAK